MTFSKVWNEVMTGATRRWRLLPGRGSRCFSQLAACSSGSSQEAGRRDGTLDRRGQLGPAATRSAALALCKCLLSLTPAQAHAYRLMENVTRGFHKHPKRSDRLPQECANIKFFAGSDGAHNSTSRGRGFRIQPTCPILTNSAWRASSFFRADLGDSGKTSLKDRLLSMF